MPTTFAAQLSSRVAGHGPAAALVTSPAQRWARSTLSPTLLCVRTALQRSWEQSPGKNSAHHPSRARPGALPRLIPALQPRPNSQRQALQHAPLSAALPPPPAARRSPLAPRPMEALFQPKPMPSWCELLDARLACARVLYWSRYLGNGLLYTAPVAWPGVATKFWTAADPLAIVLAASLLLGALCFLLSMPTRNYSWVREIWLASAASCGCWGGCLEAVCCTCSPLSELAVLLPIASPRHTPRWTSCGPLPPSPTSGSLPPSTRCGRPPPRSTRASRSWCERPAAQGLLPCPGQRASSADKPPCSPPPCAGLPDQRVGRPPDLELCAQGRLPPGCRGLPVREGAQEWLPGRTARQRLASAVAETRHQGCSRMHGSEHRPPLCPASRARAPTAGGPISVSACTRSSSSSSTRPSSPSSSTSCWPCSPAPPTSPGRCGCTGAHAALPCSSVQQAAALAVQGCRGLVSPRLLIAARLLVLASPTQQAEPGHAAQWAGRAGRPAGGRLHRRRVAGRPAAVGVPGATAWCGQHFPPAAVTLPASPHASQPSPMPAPAPTEREARAPGCRQAPGRRVRRRLLHHGALPVQPPPQLLGGAVPLVGHVPLRRRRLG